MAKITVILTDDERDILIFVAAEKGFSHGGVGAPATYMAYLARTEIIAAREKKEKRSV